MRSQHPEAIKYGYCPACQTYTSAVPFAEFTDEEWLDVLKIYGPDIDVMLVEAYVFRCRANQQRPGRAEASARSNAVIRMVVQIEPSEGRRFERDTFSSYVGLSVPLRVTGRPPGLIALAVLVNVTVADDGSSALLSLESDSEQPIDTQAPLWLTPGTDIRVTRVNTWRRTAGPGLEGFEGGAAGLGWF